MVVSPSGGRSGSLFHRRSHRRRATLSGIHQPGQSESSGRRPAPPADGRSAGAARLRILFCRSRSDGVSVQRSGTRAAAFPNAKLLAAARLHSQDMLSMARQQHVGSDSALLAAARRLKTISGPQLLKTFMPTASRSGRATPVSGGLGNHQQHRNQCRWRDAKSAGSPPEYTARPTAKPDWRHQRPEHRQRQQGRLNCHAGFCDGAQFQPFVTGVAYYDLMKCFYDLGEVWA